MTAVDYDPSNEYGIKVWDVEFRRDPIRTLMARIYQPQGKGPFPALLDFHGGAWNDQDRTANAPMDEKLAASGILVVAIDLRLAAEAPYPASVADANYGIRWLKTKAD
jgi:acetyl esterase